MGYDKKLYRDIKNAVGEDNIDKDGNSDFYVPIRTIKPHIHFYSDGCELRYKTGTGIKLIYNSNQKNEGNLSEAKEMEGAIGQAAEIIDTSY